VTCKRHDAHLVDDIDYHIEEGTGRLRRTATPTSHTPPVVWEEQTFDQW